MRFLQIFVLTSFVVVSCEDKIAVKEGSNSPNTSSINLSDNHVLKKSPRTDIDDDVDIQDNGVFHNSQALNIENDDIENESSEENEEDLEIVTENPKTATLVAPTRTGNRRWVPVIYKNDRPGSNNHTASGSGLRKGVPVRNGNKRTKTDGHHVHLGDESEQESTTHDDDGENSYHKKKRLHQNTSNPSAQLIILVVGAVLSCVLLTGFIRWRVRRRLNAKKLKKMADNYFIYRGRSGIPKQAMATIYECECEHIQDTSRLQDTTPHADDSNGSENDGPSKLDEDVCSHRFDRPPSWESHRHSDGAKFRSTSAGESDHHCGDKHQKSSKHKHRGHKRGHSSHHKRKHGDKIYPQRLQTIPVMQADSEETATAQPSTIVSQPTLLLTHNSPQTHRGILASVVHTWRSLSFNRDWVGQMWQEKHNVRRISDVLRGLTSNVHSDTEEKEFENVPVADVTEIQPNVLPAAMETSSEYAHENPHQNESCTETSFMKLFSHEDTADKYAQLNVSLENSLSNESDGLTDRLNQEESSQPDVEVTANTRFSETELHQAPCSDNFRRFVLINEHDGKPPEYDSLLDNSSSRHSLPRRSEHSRHHRRHRRRRSDDRERSSGPLYSRVHDSDAIEYFHSHATEATVPLVLSQTQFNMPATPNMSASSEVPSCHSDSNQEQSRGHDSFESSASGTGLCILANAVPFVQQEGIVIEQLSDGGQIIYLPPPALPSYHNDTPPPYQQ